MSTPSRRTTTSISRTRRSSPYAVLAGERFRLLTRPGGVGDYGTAAAPGGGAGGRHLTTTTSRSNRLRAPSRSRGDGTLGGGRDNIRAYWYVRPIQVAGPTREPHASDSATTETGYRPSWNWPAVYEPCFQDAAWTRNAAKRPPMLATTQTETPVTIEELAVCPRKRAARYFPYKEEVGGSSPSTPTEKRLSVLTIWSRGGRSVNPGPRHARGWGFFRRRVWVGGTSAR